MPDTRTLSGANEVLAPAGVSAAVLINAGKRWRGRDLRPVPYEDVYGTESHPTEPSTSTERVFVSGFSPVAITMPLGSAWRVDSTNVSVELREAADWGRVVNLQDTVGRALRARVRDCAPRVLSQEFIRRLYEFVSWKPDWDEQGAAPVDAESALRAMQIAQRALEVAAEPYAVPAHDGSVLLIWDFPNGTRVEFFVDESDDWEPASVTRRNESPETAEVASLDDLIELLAAQKG